MNSTNEKHTRATRELIRALGPTKVKTGAKALFRASFDSSKLSFPISAVVVSRKDADIGIVLRLANRHGVPVTVRGGGTSLTGSASPLRGGWVLDMARMNRVRIDREAGLAIVQAGALVADVQRAAAAEGWFYPPDPSSKEFSTIGGNVACNAGGMHGGKYGVTRDYVLSLSGFLPTGEPVSWGGAFKKWSAGFNLRDLWIGSEGCLGVVTGAVLKLIPLPQHRWTMLASFESSIAAMRATRALLAARVQPAIFEFLDSASVECAERATGESVFPDQAGRPVLLVELAGSVGEIRAGRKAVTEWAQEHATVFRAARNRAEAEKLWAVRRKCSGAMFAMGDRKLNEDIVLPVRSYERFVRFLAQLSKRHGLPMPTFGHVADGNLHVNIMYHEAVPRERKAAVVAVRELMEGVKRLGGAISGEHGIGLAKTPFLRLEHSPAAIGAMLAVKHALDPNGILNPGKIFEEFRVWEHTRLKIDLPWDHNTNVP